MNGIINYSLSVLRDLVSKLNFTMWMLELNLLSCIFCVIDVVKDRDTARVGKPNKI